MYEQFYGLRENPFGLAPNPAYLFLGRHHQHALTTLEYCISHAAGFAVITGEVGCGKTTVVQHFLGEKPPGMDVVVLSNIHPKIGLLLPWLLDSLGVPASEAPSHRLHRELVTSLGQRYWAGRRTVFVIDEAQNLSVEALEELRVLSNINSGRDLLLQTILIGQPELRAKLRRPRMRQFAQRILVDYHLGPLRREETHAYVAHRLQVAGGSPALISPDAIERVYERTCGVPRLVNILCDTALVYGFAEQRPTVDAELIELVLADRAGGVLPLKSSKRLPAVSVVRG
jgi:general secretion pathway protein A